MNNETGVKKGLTTQKYSKTKMLVSTEFSLILSVDYLPLFYTTRLPESPIPG